MLISRMPVLRVKYEDRSSPLILYGCPTWFLFTVEEYVFEGCFKPKQMKVKADGGNYMIYACL